VIDADADLGLGLRAFVRSAGFLSLGSAAGFLRALATAKLFAVQLGPSLVGVLSQLLNFAAVVSVVVPLGMTTGVVKMVAEARDGEELDRVAGSAFAISLVSGCVATAALLPAAGPVSSALTGSDRYGPLVALIALSFPLYNLAGAIAYVLQGFSAIGRLTRANILNAAVALAVLVPLTLLLGLAGAILAVLVTSVVQCGLFGVELALAYRERGRSLLGLRVARCEARSLLGFGAVLLTGSVTIWTALLVVRTLLVRELGQYDNGLYQAVYGLSNQYVTVFMTWMGAYVVPRVAAQGVRSLTPLVGSTLRANLFLMVPALTLVVALREPLIRLFFSQQFTPAASLVPIQALGDYARVVGWSLGACLFPLGRTRQHLLLVAGQGVLWVAATALLLPVLHLVAVPTAYALSFLGWAPLAYLLLRRVGLEIGRGAVALAGLGLVCVLAASWLPAPYGALAIPVVPLAVLASGRRSAGAGS
jgi:O-antigen/teichoic acid export membrane protein